MRTRSLIVLSEDIAFSTQNFAKPDHFFSFILIVYLQRKVTLAFLCKSLTSITIKMEFDRFSSGVFIYKHANAI